MVVGGRDSKEQKLSSGTWRRGKPKLNMGGDNWERYDSVSVKIMWVVEIAVVEYKPG